MKFNSCFSKCFSFPSETAIIDIRKEEPEPENDKNFTVFSYTELKVATHGFSASNKIGEGRENLRAAKKEFNKTEDYLKSLQSVGQIIGEVLRPPDNERCIWCKKHPPEVKNRDETVAFVVTRGFWIGHYTIPKEMNEVCNWLTARLGLEG
ncbi:hypothetical protein J1N35_000222 [Gossypium stocksii]|uniref:Uncharacterized protein n=1 Tax=Gossypium stocksii TaxID=47602 RepID=A0A9D3WGF7_9ROSI|nr:hypothetical protein J1N35_000222 [Gossypium stocksii]